MKAKPQPPAKRPARPVRPQKRTRSPRKAHAPSPPAAPGTRPPGRPPGTHSRTADLEESLLDWLFEARGSLRQWCRTVGVPIRTVYQWKDDDPEFAARFARAREAQREVLADELVEIADDLLVAVDRAELRIETREKYLATIDPNRYGKRLAVTGAKDAPPVAPLGSDWAAVAALAGMLEESGVTPPAAAEAAPDAGDGLVIHED